MELAHRSVATFWRSDGERIVFARGRGHRVWDDRGREYIDLVNGYGPVVIGHSDPEFLASVGDLLADGLHFPSYSYWHRHYVEEVYGEEWRAGAAAFFKSSSEAVTAALRLAARQTGRLGVVRCGYTGWHDVQLAGSVAWHEPLSSPLRHTRREAEWFRGVSRNEAVFNWVDLEAGSLQKLLAEHGDVIGSVVVDAYQDCLTSTGVLAQVVDLCRDAGIASIVDETKTAGRVSPKGLCFERGHRPDYLVTGKAIANGAPLSVLLVSAYDRPTFEAARVGGTHSKELFGVAAGLATHRIMRVRDGFVKLGNAGVDVCRALNEAAEQTGTSSALVAVPRFGGSMFDLIFDPRLQGDRQLRSTLQVAFADAGILLLVGHPSFVALAHDGIPLDELTGRANRALTAWKRLADKSQ
jgi:glutamate-1-semialdehyde 2,1-aminomutase